MKRKLVLGAIMVAIPLAALSATPTLKLTVPPPGRYGVEDLWKVTVTADTVCDAWFEGRVFEATHGQVFHATTKPFRLALGTRLYQYRDVQIDKTETAAGYETFVTRSGQLPAGKYRFKLMLQPFGVGDSNQFEVKPMGSPRLILPRQGETIKTTSPQFTWTPPSPLPKKPVTYELRLYEVLPGQTPKEAAASNPAWFEQAGITGPRLVYPAGARPLDRGASYAWQVDVLDATTRVKLAKSDVSEFTAGGAGGSGLLTRQQVIDVVLAQVVVPPTLNHTARVFLGMSALGRGDRVRPFYDGRERILDRPTWFSWVDDEPQAFFSHPTRYVFVDAYTGRVAVTSENWWPVVNDVSLWMSDKEWTDKDLIIYSDVNCNR